MKELKQWLQAHPLKAMAFEAFFVGIAVAVAFRDDWLKWGCIIYAALTVLWAVTMWLDIKKMMAIVLAALMLGPVAIGQETPRRQQQEGVGIGVGVGVVVVCVGGYCVYKLVKFCQRKFPKESGSGDTNQPPAGFVAFATAGVGIGGDTYGGSKNKGEIGSCFSGDMEFTLIDGEVPPEHITIVLDCFVEHGPNGPSIQHSVSFRKGDDVHQTWQEFRDEVAAQGLYLSGHADGTEYFSKNGQPCQPGEVPIVFAEDGTVIHLAGGPPHTIAVSRSTNMVDWMPLMQTTVGEGTGFRVVDTSIHQVMFFKVQLVDPAP